MNDRLITIRNRIKGPVFSILTPFVPSNDKIDFNSLELYIEKIYNAGGFIFYVMAYNSRYSQLTFEEIKLLNEFVVLKVKELDSENIVIVADPPHCSTASTIEFARHAESSGADLISLIVRERYYFDEQIFTHFRMVNDSVDIGILIHEMPFLSGLGGPLVNWPFELLDRIADLEKVVAIKEDAKADEYSEKAIQLLKDRLAIIISGGGKRQWLRFAAKGCQAWLNGIGVFEPRLATTFWNAWNCGNERLLYKIVDEIEAPFFEYGVRKYGWHLTIKVALEHFGMMSAHDRMPLMPMPKENAEEFIQVLDRLPVCEIVNLSENLNRTQK